MRDLEHNFGTLNSEPISTPFLPAPLMTNDDQNVTRERARLIQGRNSKMLSGHPLPVLPALSVHYAFQIVNHFRRFDLNQIYD
jgi:hypothetical protein